MQQWTERRQASEETQEKRTMVHTEKGDHFSALTFAKKFLVARSEGPHVHEGLAVSSTQRDTFVVAEDDSPNCATGLDEFANEEPSSEV